MHGCGQTAKLPSVWPYLALSAVLALLVDLGAGFHAHHNSDSLVPVLASLYHWTPFYWGGNRVGMLLPALALPFPHPFHNLLAQVWLTLFAAFSALFLLARFALPRPGWPLAGCAAAGLLLLLPTKFGLFTLTFQQMHYPVGLALGLAALLALGPATPRRLLAAFALLTLAAWVNSSTVLILGPLVVARALLRPGWPTSPRDLVRRLALRETAAALGVLFAAYLGADLNRRCHPVYDDPVKLGLAAPTTWPSAWLALARDAVTCHWVAPYWPYYLAPVVLAAALLLVPSIRRGAAGPLRATVAVLAAGTAYALVMGAIRWVQVNGDWRYWFPCYYFALAALAVAVVGPLAERCRPRPRAALTALAAATLLLLIGWQYGLPSPARARADLDRAGDGGMPARAADLIASGATHLAGDYWTVMAACYHTNLRLYESGARRPVWPVTVTAMEAWDKWGRIPPAQMRLAVPLLGGAPDPEAARALRQMSPLRREELTVVQRRPTCWVLRPTGEVALERPLALVGAGVLATWHSGFYMLEGAVGCEGRWCQRRGELTLTNAAGEDRAVTLWMQLSLGSAQPARVWIDGPGVHDVCEVSRQGTVYCCTVTVPARGAGTLVFTTDAPQTAIHNEGWRRAHFRVSNFELLEQGFVAR